MIVAKNLLKSFGNHTVLERINITAVEGEFITMVGASGCGKTTFLKMLLGVESPTQGQLSLDGKPIPDEPGADRGIVFQHYSVFSHLTALENLTAAIGFAKSGLTGHLFGEQKRSAVESSRKMLEVVGLAASEKKYPHELSGGMRQRLAIAQALIARPRVLLLDEPFGALDPGIRDEMHNLVLSLWRDYQLTVFLVTHDIKEAFKLGTRVWVFDKVRHDQQDPGTRGATITYDLPTGKH